MRLPGTRWFWSTPAVLSVVAICLVPSRLEADWTYEYQEDFSTDKAEETDNYFHSLFWPQGAYPPPEPYLYYQDAGPQRELGFGGHHDEPASLSYCFPIGSARPDRAVSGSLRIAVRKPSGAAASGYLLYRFSPDGFRWSSARELGPGTNDIWIESVRGTCYITFLGIGVLIDDLNVDLYEYSATIHVPGDAGTIQRAIDSARSGDVVEVAPDTYTGSENWDIDFRGKSITVRSTAGPAQTIIDLGGSGHRGFYFHTGEGPDSVLRGFTIKDGRIPGSEIPSDNVSWNSSPSHPIGGGIYCEFSSPSIVDCVVSRCAAEVGGGIGCVYSDPTIIDCTIEQCRAGGGGAAESGGYGAGIGVIRDSNATMINCLIEDNTGYHDSLGGGVYCWQGEVFLAGCTVASNGASGDITGGGIYCGGSDSEVALRNCIISENTAEKGGGVFIGSAPGSSSDGIREYASIVNCTIANNNLPGSKSATGGGIHSVSSNIAVRNSIVWYNDGEAILLHNPSSSSPVRYSDVEWGYAGQGNIDKNPRFVSVAAGDYHLQSRLGRYDPRSGVWVKDNYHSLCVDAGDPQDPVGAEPLTNGKCINMGAYGGTAEASKGNDAYIWHVDGAGGNDFLNEGLSRFDAFKTIQTAVDAAEDGDVVMVWPGTYSEAVWLRSKSITIQSADTAAVVTAPSPAYFAFDFYGAETSNCVVRNFIITRCEEGAVYCNGASPTLANLTITGNVFGIVAEGGANPDIVNCILWNNGNNEDDDFYHCRSVRYSCVAQMDVVTPDSGNFSEEPLFADPDNEDYHLMSIYGRYDPDSETWVYVDSDTSRCIDAGDPDMGPGREQWPHGSAINLGAYGGTPFASLSSSSW